MTFLSSLWLWILLGIKLGACAASATIVWGGLAVLAITAYLILVMMVGRFLRLAGD